MALIHGSPTCLTSTPTMAQLVQSPHKRYLGMPGMQSNGYTRTPKRKPYHTNEQQYTFTCPALYACASAVTTWVVQCPFHWEPQEGRKLTTDVLTCFGSSKRYPNFRALQANTCLFIVTCNCKSYSIPAHGPCTVTAKGC